MQTKCLNKQQNHSHNLLEQRFTHNFDCNFRSPTCRLFKWATPFDLGKVLFIHQSFLENKQFLLFVSIESIYRALNGHYKIPWQWVTTANIQLNYSNRMFAIKIVPILSLILSFPLSLLSSHQCMCVCWQLEHACGKMRHDIAYFVRPGKHFAVWFPNNFQEITEKIRTKFKSAYWNRFGMLNH